MGLFSKNCVCCHHSVLGPYALHEPNIDRDLADGETPVEHNNAWMNDVVMLAKDGTTVMGRYDGYGRIDTDGGGCFEIIDAGYDMGIGGAEMKFVHRACWEAMGRPGYDDLGPDEQSCDQGHFINHLDYDHPEPKTRADVEAIGKTPAPSMWGWVWA